MRALLLALWASAAACAHGAAASYRVTDRPPRLAGRAPWGIFFEVRSLAWLARHTPRWQPESSRGALARRRVRVAA